MRTKIRVWRKQALLLCCLVMVCSGLLEKADMNRQTYAATTNKEQGVTCLRQTVDDKLIIPDKYNTGTSGKLKKVQLADTIENIQFMSGSDNTRNVLDFYYMNIKKKGTIIFENYDFSVCPLSIYHADQIDRNIKLVFKNCKFSQFAGSRSTTKIKLEFERCSFHNFSGSNAMFDRCKFGQSYNDGLNPFQNVTVKNCFFYDLGSKKSIDTTIHSDGTQIYGWKDIDAKNIIYKNCRFEIPPIAPEGSKAGVNACIMLQLEYSNGTNIHFEDCIVNGGGYSIYAESKFDVYNLKNASFKNIRVGCAKKYGNVYPKMSPEVSFYSMSETDKLYISSVWKEKNKTFLSVTNDTCRQRKLLVITDKGAFKYSIPACKKGNQMTSKDKYEDMPFDQKIIIPKQCKYIICYDNTFSGAAKQIRFVNWSKKTVYLTKKEGKKLFPRKKDIIASGKCAENVKYTITKNGVLTLSGKGETYSYNSGEPAPWIKQADIIKTIKINKGITTLGNQLFSDCIAVQKVTLPSTIKTIGSRTFYGCFYLQKIQLPNQIKSIGDLAFSNWTKIQYK